MTNIGIMDPQIGELTYRNGWIKEIELTIFNTLSNISLSFEGELSDVELDTTQKRSYSDFASDEVKFISIAESVILDFYKSNIAEIANKLEENQEEINDLAYLRKKVNLKEVFFPVVYEDSTLFGLLFDCEWEPALGIAIVFKNGSFSEIGPQDIIL